MDKILELLGLEKNANQTEIEAAVTLLKSESEDAKAMTVSMRQTIENLEEQIKGFSSVTRDMQANDVVNQVQSETKRYLGKDSLPKLQSKAVKYVMEKDEDIRNEIMEDMKTMCVAFGVNSGLQQELKNLSTEDPTADMQGESNLEKRVNRVKKLAPEMKYEEIIKKCTDEDSYKQLIEDLKGDK